MLHVRNHVHHVTTHAMYERNMHVACGRKHESHGEEVCVLCMYRTCHMRNVSCMDGTRHMRKMHVSSGGMPALCERKHACGA